MDRSVGGSSARTVTVLLPALTSGVTSNRNGTLPPSWLPASWPFTHTIAR
jgi:hypothetical protein